MEVTYFSFRRYEEAFRAYTTDTWMNYNLLHECLAISRVAQTIKMISLFYV